jgi:hypothetical protein
MQFAVNVLEALIRVILSQLVQAVQLLNLITQHIRLMSLLVTVVWLLVLLVETYGRLFRHVALTAVTPNAAKIQPTLSRNIRVHVNILMRVEGPQKALF